MELLIILLYCSLVCFCISRIKFFSNSGIKIKWWILIFLLKVIVGILYGYIHSFSYGGGDTLYAFNRGIRIYNLIASHGFSVYAKLVFLPCHYPPYAGIDRWTHNDLSYGDESYYLLVRLHAIFALISFGYYNVHVVLFNILSFMGVVLTYFSFKRVLNEKSILLLLGCCCIPSIVFWTSGIHKDGLALLGISFLFFSIQKNSLPVILKIFSAALGLILLWIIRPYIIIIFLPLLPVYLFFQERKSGVIIYYLTSISLAVIFSLLVSYFIPSYSLFAKITWWQQAFAQLETTPNSVYLPAMKGDFISFLSVLPYSILHSFFEPFIWRSSNIYQLIISVQDMLLLLFLFYFFIKRIRAQKMIPHLFYLSIGYAFGLYILLGMIVPNLGALSRYKSTGTLFLFMAVLSLVPDDWDLRIAQFFSGKSLKSNIPSDLVSQ